MTASDSTIGLSHSFLLYPKEDQYTIRFTLGDDTDLSLFPDYDVMAFDINDTYVGLNVMYNDTLTSSTGFIHVCGGIWEQNTTLLCRGFRPVIERHIRG